MWDLICQHWRMDNLTHSLVGALLGQMGLKRKTGLAMPTLILAENIPDIDAVAVLLGGNQHLAIRRGLTHGPIAMVILPLLLSAAMLWFDTWQTKRGKRPDARLPVHKGWLLALAYVGCLSHPLFDWFNVYGIRLLEPFSSRWFYGDTLFIIDVWIWGALALGVWLSLRRERRERGNWRRAAWISFTAVCGYIFLNGAITGLAEAQASEKLRARYDRSASMPDATVVASPVPVMFWARDILWRDDIDYGAGYYSIGSGLSLDTVGRLHGADLMTLSDMKLRMKDGRSYLFWSRMPVVEQTKDGPLVRDQRFNDPRVGDRFTLKR
jgi:inner membrane protein